MIPLSCLLFKYAQDEQQQQPQQQKSWFLRHPYATAAGAGALGVGAAFAPAAARSIYNYAKPHASAAWKAATNPENIKHYAWKAAPIMAESAGKEVGHAVYKNINEGTRIDPLDLMKKSLVRGGKSVASKAAWGVAGKALGAGKDAIFGPGKPSEPKPPDKDENPLNTPLAAGGLLGAGVSYDPENPISSVLKGGITGAAGGALAFGPHMKALGVGDGSTGGAFLKGLRDTMAYNTLGSMHSKNQQAQKKREYENFYNSLTPEQKAIMEQYNQNG